MTVLASVNNRNYNAQTNNLNFSVDAAVTRVVLTLTHGDWPTGECVRMDVSWGGVFVGTFSTSGGPVLGKGGVPTGGTTELVWSCYKPAGVTSGQARIQVMQTLSTAILVEGF